MTSHRILTAGGEFLQERVHAGVPELADGDGDGPAVVRSPGKPAELFQEIEGGGVGLDGEADAAIISPLAPALGIGGAAAAEGGELLAACRRGEHVVQCTSRPVCGKKDESARCSELAKSELSKFESSDFKSAFEKLSGSDFQIRVRQIAPFGFPALDSTLCGFRISIRVRDRLGFGFCRTKSAVCEPDEIVPEGLRAHLRWDHRHDAAAEAVMQEYGLRLPEHRELIRQLAVSRVLWGKPEF